MPYMSAAKQRPHYVNNKDFSNAVVEYVRLLQQCEKDNLPKPMLPNYIAECFLKICEGLSHKANFVRYTYREEMVMDAVENCLKAVDKFDPDTATRSGNLNAFSYFTQISWYAFLRRIQNEKRQQDIKLRYIAEGPIEDFVFSAEDVDLDPNIAMPYIDMLRQRIDTVKEADNQFKQYAKEEKKRKRRAVKVDSDLSDYLD